MILGKDIITGTAAYASETARKKLPVIISNLGLPDQNIANIGSTWFSTTENMIRQGARTLDFVSYFLKNEFEKHEGKWPQWYAGVILLYAGHVAINSSQLNIQKLISLIIILPQAIKFQTIILYIVGIQKVF